LDIGSKSNRYDTDLALNFAKSFAKTSRAGSPFEPKAIIEEAVIKGKLPTLIRAPVALETVSRMMARVSIHRLSA
jgi:hypothetical protein